jgi:hypothetical protein
MSSSAEKRDSELQGCKAPSLLIRLSRSLLEGVLELAPSSTSSLGSGGFDRIGVAKKLVIGLTPCQVKITKIASHLLRIITVHATEDTHPQSVQSL